MGDRSARPSWISRLSKTKSLSLSRFRGKNEQFNPEMIQQALTFTDMVSRSGIAFDVANGCFRNGQGEDEEIVAPPVVETEMCAVDDQCLTVARSAKATD
jgi:hypothetical protein